MLERRQAARLFKQAASSLAALEAANAANTNDLVRMGGQVSLCRRAAATPPTTPRVRAASVRM